MRRSLPYFINFVALGSGRGSRGWLCVVLFASALLVGILALSSCASRSTHEAKEALEVVQEYLTAVQSGDIELARSYWTDINNPGGTWTMVARRDMEHVTQEHRTAFAGGFEIVRSEFQAIKGLKQPISVLKLDVRVQSTGKIRKLEIGLVRSQERWYIYSMYPGTW